MQKRDISDYGIVGAFLSLASTPHPQFSNAKSNVHMYIFCYCCYGTKSLLEAGRAKDKNPYLLFGWHEKFLDHHAVPRVGASVQGVRPIRTEGAEAVVFTVTHSTVGDGDGWDGMEENKRMQL